MQMWQVFGSSRRFAVLGFGRLDTNSVTADCSVGVVVSRGIYSMVRTLVEVYLAGERG